jgi:hypothetical protein
MAVAFSVVVEFMVETVREGASLRGVLLDRTYVGLQPQQRQP